MTLKPTEQGWNPPRNQFEEKEREIIYALEVFLDKTRLVEAEIALGELIAHYHGEMERKDAMLRVLNQ